MVRWPLPSRSLNCRLGPCFRFPFSRCHGVEHHFIGLLEKVHRPPKYPETLRLQVTIQVFPGIPFFKNMEFIFILHTAAKVAAQAPLLCLYGADQGSDRLRQLFSLLSKSLHSYGDQNHTDRICKRPANKRRKIRSVKSVSNNGGLDEWKRNVGKGETIGLASIFGGTSIY